MDVETAGNIYSKNHEVYEDYKLGSEWENILDLLDQSSKDEKNLNIYHLIERETESILDSLENDLYMLWDHEERDGDDVRLVELQKAYDGANKIKDFALKKIDTRKNSDLTPVGIIRRRKDWILRLIN